MNNNRGSELRAQNTANNGLCPTFAVASQLAATPQAANNDCQSIISSHQSPRSYSRNAGRRMTSRGGLGLI